jgi:rare lipoprotein A
VVKAVSRQSAKPTKNSPYEVGTASWYGEYFQGKQTASGEPFDMQALTAAHPTLPLGSFVRVTNLRNGRAVVVRINDRGPVVEGRIIDLSYNTARVLGFEERGLQRVRLDLVRPASMARLQTVASLR